jgi:hypothetical protein
MTEEIRETILMLGGTFLLAYVIVKILLRKHITEMTHRLLGISEGKTVSDIDYSITTNKA